MVQTEPTKPEQDSLSSYVGKTRKAADSEYCIDDLPEADLARIMANLPEDDSKPADAYELSQNDLRRELVDRGIQPKGFFNDDAARLQEEYNRLQSMLLNDLIVKHDEKAVKQDEEKMIKQIIALKKADLALRNQLIENKQLGKGYHPDMEKRVGWS